MAGWGEHKNREDSALVSIGVSGGAVRRVLSTLLDTQRETCRESKSEGSLCGAGLAMGLVHP